MSTDVVRTAHHVTRHNTPIHNILSTSPQLSVSQKALETLPDDNNNIYYLQLGFHPVAVNSLHVHNL
jgi:hypothetical protein